MRCVGLAWVVAACGHRPLCEEGSIRAVGREACSPYEPGSPVAGNVPRFPNGLSWQWQLTGDFDRSHDVDVYDLDLFDLTTDTVDALHAEGRRVVCYFSAGSYESWRPDAQGFPKTAIGRPLEGWPDERWLDPTNPTVRALLEARLDLAVTKGCDAVEPDNLTAYQERSGFSVNATEQLDFNRFLADAAHERHLAVALKNDVEQVSELIDWFDFTVNEECAFYDECDTLAPFVRADKAVLHAEYVDDWDDAEALAADVCGVEPGLSTLVKTWDLGPEFRGCPDLP